MSRRTCTGIAGCAALVTMLAAGVADAAGSSGFYVGAGGGVAIYDMDFGTQVRNAYAGTPFTVDSADFGSSQKGGYKAFVGYQIIDPIAVELAYVNLGKPTASYVVHNPNGLNPRPSTRNAEYAIQGVNLSVVGTLPINDAFSLHAMLGAFYSELKFSESGSTPAGDPYSFTAQNLWQTNVSFGLGATWRIDPHWAVRADWDRFRDIGNTFDLTVSGNGQFNNVDLLSVNVVYRF